MTCDFADFENPELVEFSIDNTIRSAFSQDEKT